MQKKATVFEGPAKGKFNMVDQKVLDAHKKASNHRVELEGSEKCGCFACLRIFEPTKIQEWLDDEGTAVCPYCSTDSIISDQSGYPIEKEFLQQMKTYWFF